MYIIAFITSTKMCNRRILLHNKQIARKNLGIIYLTSQTMIKKIYYEVKYIILKNFMNQGAKRIAYRESGEVLQQ